MQRQSDTLYAAANDLCDDSCAKECHSLPFSLSLLPLPTHWILLPFKNHLTWYKYKYARVCRRTAVCVCVCVCAGLLACVLPACLTKLRKKRSNAIIIIRIWFFAVVSYIHSACYSCLCIYIFIFIYLLFIFIYFSLYFYVYLFVSPFLFRIFFSELISWWCFIFMFAHARPPFWCCCCCCL